MNAQLEWRGQNVQYHVDTQVMEKDAKVGVTVQKTTVVLQLAVKVWQLYCLYYHVSNI